MTGDAKECGHPVELTYPASDAWRCTVCNRVIDTFEESDENARVNNSETREETERSIAAGNKQSGGGEHGDV
jgi:hypothetical protein